MQLEDALRKRMAVAVTWQGYTSLVSHLYVTPDGERLAFADVGWLENTDGHPVHHVKGKITGDGPWLAGDATFFALEEESDEHNDMWMTWCWIRGIEMTDGHDYEKAVKILAKEF